jgi:type IV pilus assembly protein PilC
MREYNYVAKNEDGEKFKGTLEAESEEAAVKLLSAKDLFPVSIDRKQESSFSLFGGVSPKDKVFLVRQLATILNAGLPISQALATLSNQTANATLKNILEQVARDVEGGTNLSTSFAQYPKLFTNIEITLIASGEASGTLDKVLVRLANNIENDFKMRRIIQNAMIYPAFILATIILVIVGMNIFVLPKMESIYASFNGAQLPAVTKVMMSVSHFANTYWYILFFVIVGLILLTRWAISTPVGRYYVDDMKLKMPTLGKFFQNVYMARFTRTLSGLVGSGVSILDSLKITIDSVGNKIIGDDIKIFADKVKAGIPLSTPVKENEHFPSIVGQMIAIGEQSGEMDAMLEKLAEYFEDEVDSFVKNISSVIEPIVILLLAFMIGFILIAVMLPIYRFGAIV